MNRSRRGSKDVREYERTVRWLGRRMGLETFGCTVLLCEDREIEELNRKFLGRPRPTDVLAFPWEGEPGAVPYLGDLAISVETAARQAARHKRSIAKEVRELMVHGFLHLLGFDHEKDQGEMKRWERVLLQDMGRTRLRRCLPPREAR